MSRIVVFRENGYSAGEIHATCSRGWALNEGGSTTFTLGALEPVELLGFGRMVMIEHDELPAWAGMIDPPWGVVQPATATAYDAPYLLHTRTPDQAGTLKGTAGAIALQMLALANAQGDLRIVPGEVDTGGVQREENLDVRPFWEQMTALAKRAGLELRLRPRRDANNRLVLYLDLLARIGVDTGALLHDGPGANMEVVAGQSKVDGEIWNRVTGIGSGGTLGSRLTSAPHNDSVSQRMYGVRSRAVQFQGVKESGTLEENTAVSLAESAYPELYLQVNVLDVGGIFRSLDLGNGVMVHAANLVFPGGVRGWRGAMRIQAMTYDEGSNKVAMNLRGEL